MMTCKQYGNIVRVLLCQEKGKTLTQFRKEGFMSAPHWINNFTIRTVKCDDMEETEIVLLKKEKDEPLDQ